jgi:hypothetical protein
VSGTRCAPPGAGPLAGGGDGGRVGTVGTVGVETVGGTGALTVGSGTEGVGSGTLTLCTGLVTVGRLDCALAGETAWPGPNPAQSASAPMSNIRLLASLAIAGPEVESRERALS